MNSKLMHNSLLSKMSEYMLARKQGSNGISGFGSMKFYVVFLLYLSSFLLFMHDPFFALNGRFSFQQGIVPMLMAYLIIAMFCWELSFMGKNRGANLLLQVMLVFPLTLFIARMTSDASSAPTWLFEKLGEITQSSSLGFLVKASKSIPKWLTEAFTNWKLSLMLLLFLATQCVKKVQFRVSAMCTLLLLPVFTTLQSGDNVSWFAMGSVAMIAGISMQFCRYDRIIFFENVVRKMSGGGDAIVLTIIMKVMGQLREKGRLSEPNLIHLVRTEYEKHCEVSAADARLMAGKITQMMLYEYGLAMLRNDSDGIYLVPSPSLYYNDCLLGTMSLFPKIVIVCVIALLWVILPYDLIPDALPIVGALDDVTVALLSGMLMKSSASLGQGTSISTDIRM